MSNPNDLADSASEYSSSEEVEIEEEISDNPDEAPSINTDAAGKRNNGIWESMFRRLVDYKEKHGHCRVPYRYPEHPPLGMWVAVQRRQYKLLHSGRCKKTPLTPERERRLKKIGFEWTAESRRWETRFAELLEFVTINGHAQVPTKWKENSKLSSWVSAQRREYKSLKMGRPSALTHGRIQLLNSIGFVWQAERGGTKRLWEGKVVPVAQGSKASTTSPLSRCVAENMLRTLKEKKNAIGKKKSAPRVSRNKRPLDPSVGIDLALLSEKQPSFGFDTVERRMSALGSGPSTTAGLPPYCPDSIAMDIGTSSLAENILLRQSLRHPSLRMPLSSLPLPSNSFNSAGFLTPVLSPTASLYQSLNNDLFQSSKADISERLRAQSLLLDKNLEPPAMKLQNLLKGGALDAHGYLRYI